MLDCVAVLCLCYAMLHLPRDCQKSHCQTSDGHLLNFPLFSNYLGANISS